MEILGEFAKLSSGQTKRAQRLQKVVFLLKHLWGRGTTEIIFVLVLLFLTLYSFKKRQIQKHRSGEYNHIFILKISQTILSTIGLFDLIMYYSNRYICKFDIERAKKSHLHIFK